MFTTTTIISARNFFQYNSAAVSEFNPPEVSHPSLVNYVNEWLLLHHLSVTVGDG